jgi:uncharacterized protein (DUF1501 family)
MQHWSTDTPSGPEHFDADCAERRVMRGALSRRGLLGAGASFFAWSGLPKVASAAGATDPRLLVVILRGAMDGLSAVPPIQDPAYAALRGDIALPKEGTYGALPLDGLFALHPSMKNFARMYRERKASVVHAVASPYRERSHFDGQDLLESGFGKVARADSGWLNRAIAALPSSGKVQSTKGLAVGAATPLILRGSAPVLGWAPQIVARATDDLTNRLLNLYRHQDPRLAAALQSGIETDQLARSQGMSNQARQQDVRNMVVAAEGAAQLLAASDGPRIAALSFDGWDTHANQGGATGRLADLLSGLDDAFAAFERVLAPVWRQTAVLVVTEFGRTARVNGTVGSDHGTGTAAFLLGGAIAGGRIFADWPGLADSQLFENRDLRPTLDLRAVFKGVLHEHLGLSKVSLDAVVFPESLGVRAMTGLIV